MSMPNDGQASALAKEHHGWIFSHPYGIAIASVALLLFIGAMIVSKRSATSEVKGTSAWGGGIQSLINASEYAPTKGTGVTAQEIQNNAPYTYVLPDLTYKPSEDTEEAQNGVYDYGSILSQLSQKSGTTATTSTADIEEAYSYIPQGLIGTTQKEPALTKEEQQLYRYGNDVGSLIQAFESTHTSMVQVLKDQVEDVSNPQKVAAVVALGRDLEQVGSDMLALESVPQQVTGMHKALAESYQEIGNNLALVPNAKRSSDILQAITTYNASAETFAKNFVTLALLFSVSGVKFSAEDPGSVFVFQQQ